MVSLWNRSSSSYTVNPGDRVAQLVIKEVQQEQLPVLDTIVQPVDGDIPSAD